MEEFVQSLPAAGSEEHSLAAKDPTKDKGFGLVVPACVKDLCGEVGPSLDLLGSFLGKTKANLGFSPLATACSLSYQGEP